MKTCLRQVNGKKMHPASWCAFSGCQGWRDRIYSFITTRLASRVTPWTRFEDRQLFRCISYINCTRDFILKGEFDPKEEPILDIYTGADFGSCQHTSKSTSGLWMQITTGGCAFPVFWQAKKQGSVARSTTEAEVISMASGMFSEALNTQVFIDYRVSFTETNKCSIPSRQWCSSQDLAKWI